MQQYCPNCMMPIQEEGDLCQKCGGSISLQNDVNQLQPGTVLNGRYYIGKAIGAGGFGITYMARDILLDTKVAVKEFFPSQAASRVNSISAEVTIVKNTSGENERIFEKGRENFLNEARTVAKFKNNRGIVDVQDIFHANNTAYIVMEFLEGETLGDYIKSHGHQVSYTVGEETKGGYAISYEEAISILGPIIKALHAVHNDDVVHRDISPDNIMVNDGRGTLFDFGAARNRTSDTEKSLTVVLKYGYAPLEQHRRNGKQGPWTDIYALCATLYRCIVGIPPMDVLDRLESDGLVAPSVLGVSMPAEAEQALLSGLSINYQKRPQTVMELYDRLVNSALPEVKTPAVESKHVIEQKDSVDKDSKTVEPKPEIEQKNKPVDKKIEQAPIKPKKNKTWVLFLIIGVVVIVIGAIIGISMMGMQDDDDSGSSKSSKSNKSSSSGTLSDTIDSVLVFCNLSEDNTSTYATTFYSSSEDPICVHLDNQGSNTVKIDKVEVINWDTYINDDSQVYDLSYNLTDKYCFYLPLTEAGNYTIAIYDVDGYLVGETDIIVE